MKNSILPLYVYSPGEVPYGGFWRRFGAYWLDALICIPWFFLIQYINNHGRLNIFYTLIPSYAFFIGYSIYTVKRWGGTPGKLLSGIRIVRKDGNKCGWKEAILRESVLFTLGIPTMIATLLITLNISDQQFHSMTWMQFAHYRQDNMPVWQPPFYWATQIWIWSEFLVLLVDTRRRALHDYVAGTVVIKSMYKDWAEQVAGGDATR